jgi:hypothetical protein
MLENDGEDQLDKACGKGSVMEGNNLKTAKMMKTNRIGLIA